MIESPCLPLLIRKAGKAVSRQKLQRPEVYAWRGKSGVRYWKAEWRVYLEGRKPKHRSKTWLQKDYSKAEAQKECDKLVQQETGAPSTPDGAMLVREFWDEVFWPSRKRRVAPNTVSNYEAAWSLYIRPAIGKQQLQHVNKSAVSGILDAMADLDRSGGYVEATLSLMRSMFREAQESGYILRNPAYGVTAPRCKPKQETRPLSADEVRRIFDTTTGRDRLIWRILCLTGARIGEVLALRREDLIPAGLQIDESAYRGKAAPTKTRKIRYAPIPDDLRREIEQWESPFDLLFPTLTVKMHQRSSEQMALMVKRVRKAAGIPDLTPRMARTTFATLFDGDVRDAQVILGHENLSMTLGTYRKPQAARMQAGVDALNARFSGKVVEMPKAKEA